MGRRPRPLPSVRRGTPRRGGGPGDKRDQREAVSVRTGLMPKHHPRVHPTPAAAPREGGNARRPAPPVSRAKLDPSACGGEPVALRMATEPGTNAYRDRPGRCPRHSRPALRSGAAGVRMSVGCGSSRGPGGPGAASAADSQAGSRSARLRHGRCHPGADAQSVTVPGKGNYCLLTSRAL